MPLKLLTEHRLEFLSLKGDCTGSSESTHVKMPHCWKSHVTAQLCQNMLALLNLIYHSTSGVIPSVLCSWSGLCSLLESELLDALKNIIKNLAFMFTVFFS